jgi:hypothetical protein
MGERGARARSVQSQRGASVGERTGPVRRPEPNRDVAADRDLDGVAPVARLRSGRAVGDTEETVLFVAGRAPRRSIATYAGACDYAAEGY